MITEISNQDKLKVIVQAMLDGGWEPIKEKPRVLQVQKNLTVLIEYSYINYARKDQRVQEAYIAISFPDLLSDSSAMEAVFGIKNTVMSKGLCDHMCNKKGTEAWTFDNLCYSCDNFKTAHEYHAKKAFDIIYSGGDGVGYVYDELIKLKGGAK